MRLEQCVPARGCREDGSALELSPTLRGEHPKGRGLNSVQSTPTASVVPFYRKARRAHTGVSLLWWGCWCKEQ